MRFVNGIEGVSWLDRLGELFGDSGVYGSEFVEPFRLETLFVPFYWQDSVIRYYESAITSSQKPKYKIPTKIITKNMLEYCLKVYIYDRFNTCLSLLLLIPCILFNIQISVSIHAYWIWLPHKWPVFGLLPSVSFEKAEQLEYFFLVREDRGQKSFISCEHRVIVEFEILDKYMFEFAFERNQHSSSFKNLFVKFDFCCYLSVIPNTWKIM